MRSQLIGHGLAVYPPHAARPLDGKYHAPAGEDAAYRMTRKYKKTHSALVRLLSSGEQVPAGLAADLEAITEEPAVLFDAWEQTLWAFDPRVYLRAAAALAFDITSGDRRPGTRASVRAVADWYRIPDLLVGKAIAKLVVCGMLTRSGGHRTGMRPPEDGDRSPRRALPERAGAVRYRMIGRAWWPMPEDQVMAAPWEVATLATGRLRALRSLCLAEHG